MQQLGVKRQKSGDSDPNLLFYSGRLASQPKGGLIDDIHADWDGEWERLERHHGYIQWLFPVFENAGMNHQSSPLTKAGARAIRTNERMSLRVVASYKLMLRFYGLKLTDERTGAVERDESDADGARVANFNQRAHNFLRVSRILTSLGELGFHRYKRPLLDALRVEVKSGRLRNARQSFQTFWSPLVDDEASEWYARKTLERAADREEGCLFAPGGMFAEGVAEAEGGDLEPAPASDAAGASEAEPAAASDAPNAAVEQAFVSCELLSTAASSDAPSVAVEQIDDEAVKYAVAQQLLSDPALVDAALRAASAEAQAQAEATPTVAASEEAGATAGPMQEDSEEQPLIARGD